MARSFGARPPSPPVVPRCGSDGRDCAVSVIGYRLLADSPPTSCKRRIGSFSGECRVGGGLSSARDVAAAEFPAGEVAAFPLGASGNRTTAIPGCVRASPTRPGSAPSSSPPPPTARRRSVAVPSASHHFPVSLDVAQLLVSVGVGVGVFR